MLVNTKFFRLSVLCILGMGALAASACLADEEVLTGSYWYVLDNIKTDQEGGVIELYAALPYESEESQVEVTAITPEPLTILTDEDQGNRVAVWRIEVQPGQENMFFNYNFKVTNRHRQFDRRRWKYYHTERRGYAAQLLSQRELRHV